MQWIVLLVLFIFSGQLFAHQIQSITQHVKILKQNEAGLQQDLIGRIGLNRKIDVGVQGTYLERFDFFDKRFGGFATYRSDQGTVLEAKFLQGMGNKILPEKDLILTAYQSTSLGITPFAIYRNSKYSATDLHATTVGIEIEKISSIIIVPSLMLGKATFHNPSETEDVYGLGLRVFYYKENSYSVSGFLFKGKEASQSVIGQTSSLVDTLTGGASFAWFFSPDFKTEIIFDHTDYDELKTQFLTTTLNLSRTF